MVLADSSIWIRFFRTGDTDFQRLLERTEIFVHPAVIGELACGTIKNRSKTLDTLKLLPKSNVATTDEALYLLDTQRIHGTGLGWVDVQLIASALLTSCSLWTLDKRLSRIARKLGCGFIC